MITLKSVIVLGSHSTNKRGDLFASSLRTLFSALGYQDFRLNIHKTGREIDVEGAHSQEHRKLIAECKATAAPVGGKDVNTLMGKVEVERRKDSTPIQAYFLSLSGFTESAIEQEKDAGKRVVLLDSSKIISSLVNSKILVDPALASEKSGRLVPADALLVLQPECHLVIADIGNIWLFFYARDSERTSFSLIHGDGSYISSTLAAELSKDGSIKSLLKGLKYLGPKQSSAQSQSVAAVRRKYLSYLSKACGEIQLDGLPADQELGTKSLKLESLFVPMKLIKAQNQENVSLRASDAKNEAAEELGVTEDSEEAAVSVSVGNVLGTENRIALLGLPGSGKSTLIKRLAIAYAFPSRKAQIDDGLPDKKMLPIFIRCRQLGSQVTSPILTILNDICKRAEIEDSQAHHFHGMVLEAVKSGRGLLLIDGLDEIASESERVAFVAQLRLFLAQYPAVSLVLTSRNAGFRVIGSTLSSECKQYNLSPFDGVDIKHLIVAWHILVVGNRKEVVDSANALAETINDSSRLRKLAENPLLLTTLLIIKRWVTQLPTKRSVLYGRAVEVLLMTWNVEGHQPLDPEEVIPQLSFVALRMMKNGVQRIAHGDLQRELYEARRSMPDILCYAKMSVKDFISGVELRSSLLLQSGHEVRDGAIQPIYEFRHLLFQEYLAAKAAVELYIPSDDQSDSVSILRPHFQDSSWQEVILLAASLGGRRSLGVLRELTSAASLEPKGGTLGLREEQFTRSLLAQCLADEVPLAGIDLDRALLEVIPIHELIDLERSRYGDRLRAVCSAELWAPTKFRLMQSGGHLGRIDCERIAAAMLTEDLSSSRILEGLSADGRDSVEALFSCAIFAYLEGQPMRRGSRVVLSVAQRRKSFRENMLLIGDCVAKHLESNVVQAQVGAAWALAWLAGFWPIDRRLQVIKRLFQLWKDSANEDVQFVSAWAIAVHPLKDESKWSHLGLENIVGLSQKIDAMLGENVKSSQRIDPIRMAILYKMYTRKNISSEERESYKLRLKEAGRFWNEGEDRVLNDYLKSGVSSKLGKKKPAFAGTKTRKV